LEEVVVLVVVGLVVACLYLLKQKLLLEDRNTVEWRRSEERKKELEGQLENVKKQIEVERANVEGIKRQAESQQEAFMALMYENQSLKDQLKALDRVNLSTKKDS